MQASGRIATAPSTIAVWQARWRALPDNVRGAFWILVSCVLFSSMAALVKVLGSRLDSFQLAFFRALFGFLLVLPFASRAGYAVLDTARPWLHLKRGIAGTIGMMCGFYGLVHLPLADVTAIGFTKPLFLIVLAALVLRASVGSRRWLATVAGFAGVLVMLRPGDGVLEFAALVALFGALAAACVKLFIKQLAGTDRPLTIMLYMGVISTLLTAVPAAWVWQAPSLLELAGIALAAGFGSLAQLCFIRAYRLGERVPWRRSSTPACRWQPCTASCCSPKCRTSTPAWELS